MNLDRVPSRLQQLLFTCTVLLLASPLAASGAEQVTITDIHLRMDNTDAQVLFRKDTFDKSSFPVTLIDGKEWYDGRVKVGGSFTRRLPKKSLYIKLDNKKRWEGQNRLSLNALASDPSLIRNWLAWELAHALGSAGPNATFRRVFLNGDPRGLYMQTDWVEPKLFERYGLGSNGQLYQPNDSTYCGDFSAAHINDTSYCWSKYVPPDNNYTDLEQLIRAINATPTADFDKLVEQYFDVDSLINWIAVNVLTDDGDTYNKNFFLYRSAVTNKWVVIPWDYDLAFGRTYDGTLPFPKDIYNDNFQYYYPPELGAPSPLKEKTLSNPKLNALFLARMAHILGLKREDNRPNFGYFSYDKLAARIDYLSSVLSPEVATDPYLRPQQAQFHSNIDAIKYYVRARNLYLENALFGDQRWTPAKANWNPDLSAPPSPLPHNLYATATTQVGDRSTALVVDGYGYILALIDASDPSTRQLRWIGDVDMAQTPDQVPPGFNPQQCIKRTWYLGLKTPGKGVLGNLTLEYLQENSVRSERGAVQDESALQLWRYEEGRWENLPAKVNPLVNTLTTEDQIALTAGRLSRFVACVPPKR